MQKKNLGPKSSSNESKFLNVQNYDHLNKMSLHFKKTSDSRKKELVSVEGKHPKSAGIFSGYYALTPYQQQMLGAYTYRRDTNKWVLIGTLLILLGFACLLGTLVFKDYQSKNILLDCTLKKKMMKTFDFIS